MKSRTIFLILLTLLSTPGNAQMASNLLRVMEQAELVAAEMR